MHSPWLLTHVTTFLTASCEGFQTLILGGREEIWVRKEVERTVVPERKDARAGVRVTKARSKEVRNTAEAMSREENDKQKNRAS